MLRCTGGVVTFSKVGWRNVQAVSDGGDLTSDGGLVLLREVDRRLELTRAAAAAFVGGRRKASVRHSIRDMLALRLHGTGVRERGRCRSQQLALGPGTANGQWDATSRWLLG